MGFSQGLGNFASPRLTRLNVINVLEDEGFVNAEQFNYRSNQRRVGMAIEDTKTLGVDPPLRLESMS